MEIIQIIPSGAQLPKNEETFILLVIQLFIDGLGCMRKQGLVGVPSILTKTVYRNYEFSKFNVKDGSIFEVRKQ